MWTLYTVAQKSGTPFWYNSDILEKSLIIFGRRTVGIVFFWHTVYTQSTVKQAMKQWIYEIFTFFSLKLHVSLRDWLRPVTDRVQNTLKQLPTMFGIAVRSTNTENECKVNKHTMINEIYSAKITTCKVSNQFLITGFTKNSWWFTFTDTQHGQIGNPPQIKLLLSHS